jgi:hypothetical protein
VVDELDPLNFDISFETITSQEFFDFHQKWNNLEIPPYTMYTTEGPHICPVSANHRPPDLVRFPSGDFYVPQPKTAKSGQQLGGELFPSQSDCHGCYRDDATLIEETDEVKKALLLGSEPEADNPFISQLSMGAFDEDSRISFQSDGGYHSETPINQFGGDRCDSVFSPPFSMSYPVPPGRSGSCVTPEPSTPYPVYPSPAPSYVSGDESQYDYYQQDKTPAFPSSQMCDYPSARYPSWTNPVPQISQNIPRISTTSSITSSPSSPKEDLKYKERREKNNKASQISRKKKKQKVQALEDRAHELNLENDSLKDTITRLEVEIAQVREQLVSFLSNKGRV